MQKNLIYKQQLKNNLVELFIGCVQRGRRSTCVYCVSLYIRRGDFIRLVDIYSKPIFLHLYIVNKHNNCNIKLAWVVYGVYRHFQQYFSYIVAVSFIDEGNRSTRRKPPTFRKSMTNCII